ncbi:BQ5605_C015g07773 [Microbotryum silenes-dioicae]|uniref:BQ5605_C015g07773 protein n=1 Tax=Microbotryum silenes-dioicae TaxID=796604 RepID=A0A2X0LT83_9BASI|nr:BQ5605_C015g07773 [Microbotryum silenes-dioicae]
MGFFQTVVTVVATLSSLGNFLAAMPLLRGEHPVVSSVESKAIELQGSRNELPYRVYSDYWPSFTYPTGGEQWEDGSEHIVRWNQKLPPYATYSQVPQTADLVLGHWDKKGMQSGENIELKHPLVKNVSLYIHGQNFVKFRLPCMRHLKENLSERQ